MASLKSRNKGGRIVLGELTKELFFKNVVESRRSQGRSIENFAFNKSRCRILSRSEIISSSSKGIIYWMNRDCRIQDNWALLFAQRSANKLMLPLYVCFLCKDAHQRYPTKRHFTFLLEGLKLLESECGRLNIGFYMLESSPEELAEIVAVNNIGGVVCDFNPLKHCRENLEMFLKRVPDGIPVVEVDAHNIVPAWEASDKQELMAKFIRPKITKKLPEFLTGFPDVCKHKYSGAMKSHLRLVDIDNAYATYAPKWDVPEVQLEENAGSEGGISMLHSFISRNLEQYGIGSNDPSKDSTSKLSPWLHFGFISAQRCALEVKSLESVYKAQCEKFLEELIVRKELSDNYCYYNNNYDNINGAADWAKATLRQHSKDKRSWVYTRGQLEKAQTHDEMWNAAQLQAVREGRIHGYMRMYWCKKVLEWTESPEQAVEYSLWLNDTFCLDGTDPNGYVGVMWSICGVHDQGWKEREIFGKIRYMVDYSLKRKFDMDSYCAKFGLKIAKNVKTKDGVAKNKRVNRENSGGQGRAKRKAS